MLLMSIRPYTGAHPLLKSLLHSGARAPLGKNGDLRGRPAVLDGPAQGRRFGCERQLPGRNKERKEPSSSSVTQKIIQKIKNPLEDGIVKIDLCSCQVSKIRGYVAQ